MTDRWPELPLDAWRATAATLHRWTQIVGKVRLTFAPLVNHWWNCTLYVGARGLGTSAISTRTQMFDIQFDFIAHRLQIQTSENQSTSFALEPQSVAKFYERLMSSLRSVGVEVAINPMPQEIPDSTPLDQDREHDSYDPEYAHRFWRALVAMSPIFDEFRGRFVGKCSPVHFFWGSFDLACTRFSGKRAPPRPGVITSEAYSHECISHGFWPGEGLGFPAFYSYTAPAPAGLADEPSTKRFWNDRFSQFILPYDDVRSARDPERTLLDFMQATYEAGAIRANWDRAGLERNG